MVKILQKYYENLLESTSNTLNISSDFIEQEDPIIMSASFEELAEDAPIEELYDFWSVQNLDQNDQNIVLVVARRVMTSRDG